MQHNQIGNKIRELRMSRNLTQAELGKLVGVSMQAVSKWERGGTPEIEVLLSVAELFGVTMDELFGRSIESSCKMEDILYSTMMKTSDTCKFDLASNYIWAIFKGLSGIPCTQDTEFGSGQESEIDGTRCRISSNEGIAYALASLNARYIAFMPEPQEGFNSIMASVEEYAALFHLLSDKDALKILLFICTRPQFLFSKKMASQETGIPEEKISHILSVFKEKGWVTEELADMDDGSVTLYRPFYKESFVFFLLFAREMMVNPRFWFLSSYTKRTKPLLKKMPPNKQEPEDCPPDKDAAP